MDGLALFVLTYHNREEQGSQEIKGQGCSDPARVLLCVCCVCFESMKPHVHGYNFGDKDTANLDRSGEKLTFNHFQDIKSGGRIGEGRVGGSW